MNETLFSRQDFYNLIWETPITTLAKIYSISESDLRKICKRMDIPTPSSGYWSKKRMGKKVSKAIMPFNDVVEQEVSLSIRKEGEVNNTTILSPIAKRQQEIENDSKVSLQVPRKLTSPDNMIIAANKSLSHKNRYWYNRGLAGTERNKDELDIKVDFGNVNRALLFMDTFIKAISKRGHKIINKRNRSYAVVYGQEIKFSLREKTKRVTITKDGWSRTENEPANIFSFTIEPFYNAIEWYDGKQKIELMLSNILAKLEVKAEELVLREKEWEVERKINAEREQLQKEIIEKQEREIGTFESLLQKAKQWEEMKLVREYLTAIEEKAITDNLLSQDLKDYISWGRQKASEIDPSRILSL